MSGRSLSTTPKQPRKIAIWFEGGQEFDLLPFMFFVTSANTAQKSFQFYFPDPPDGLTYEAADSQLKKGEVVFRNRDNVELPFDVHVFVTAAYMEGDLFFVEEGPLVRITTLGWQENFSPPSVFEYLFHSILSGAIYALTTATMHDEFTMGCQFEYTRIKEFARIGIALGYLCQEHRDAIRDELGDDVLVDVENLFKFAWLGEADKQGTVSYKMKDFFDYDLRKDSGYKKKFFERVQANLDSLWFDIVKELFKGLILILVAYLLFKFGLNSAHE